MTWDSPLQLTERPGFDHAVAPAVVLSGFEWEKGDEVSDTSSDDEVPLSYLKRSFDAEDGPPDYDATGAPLRSTPTRFNPKAPLTVLGLIVLVLGAFHTGHKHIRQNTYRGRPVLPLTMEHVFNGTFAVDSGTPVVWLSAVGDGVYSTTTANHGIELHDLQRNETRLLVDGNKILDHQGIQLWWRDFALSADGNYILFSTRWTKRWRYSSRSDFYIYDMGSSTTKSLTEISETAKTAKASWSPRGHSLAYVHEEDLYILPSPADEAAAIRVTSCMNLTIPWVIEEEVLQSDRAMWWSPDSTKLAFLTFDETHVPHYDVQIFNPDPSEPNTLPYPDILSIPYPKPGFTNPTTAAHVFDLTTRSLVQIDLDIGFPESNRLVAEAAWATSVDFIVKLTDRLGKHLKVVHYAILADKVSAKVVRDIDYSQVDKGWYEMVASMVPVPGALPTDFDVSQLPIGYLDIVPDATGFRHIAFFDMTSIRDPIYLTHGEWEVAQIDFVDPQRRQIYFTAADPSVDRRIRSQSLPTTQDLDKLRNGEQGQPFLELTKSIGYYSTSFSPHGAFYVLRYAGPDMPWSRILKVEDPDFAIQLATNEGLNATLHQLDLPSQTVKTLTIGNNTFNIFEQLPPRFDRSGQIKYPVLFRCYGGPNSQMVSHRFSYDWMSYLTASLGYITIMVDGRGTGWKGRPFRAPVSDHLGHLEAIDQIAAAEVYARERYVDENKIGIWGWSYGGYLAARVIERNSGVFKLGMSVAPVTDWRFYDSVYTERYMGDVHANAEAFRKSAITDMEGFKNADFLLAHGSGDDNVHALNSFNLLDRLTTAHIRDFRFRLFVDSDHGINRREAFRELHEQMTAFLIEKWGEIESQFRVKKMPHAPVLDYR